MPPFTVRPPLHRGSIQMKTIAFLKQKLEKPPVTGVRALPCAIAAVALPTIIRCLVDKDVSGVAFSPYVPFVLLAALALGWRYAAAVAILSAAVADMLFIEPRFVPMAGPTDAFGIAVFLVSAALIILLVQAARFVAETWIKPAPCGDKQTGIIFSLQDGQAWATWCGSQRPLRLGPEGEVAGMMQDFLAQLELGKRLCGNAD